jgi:hypothetical protein
MSLILHLASYTTFRRICRRFGPVRLCSMDAPRRHTRYRNPGYIILKALLLSFLQVYIRVLVIHIATELKPDAAVLPVALLQTC